MPWDGTSLLLMSGQIFGPSTRADQVALESVGRIRLSRAPHVAYEYLLGSGVQPMGRAAENVRRAAKETGS